MRIDLVLAPNAGPYTGPGTNTYVIVDDGQALVLDPGPVIGSHEANIVQAIGDATPVGVVVTHTHPDHAPLANPLARRLGVPAYGYAAGPEFVPDVAIADADTVTVGNRGLVAVHTPGHTPDHLCFLLDGRLFTGDHIMGGSTVVIEDAADYLDSLYKVRDLGARTIEPGHGPHIVDAVAKIDEYIAHRRMRERQVLDAVEAGAGTVDDVVSVVYAAVPADLRAAATHQVRIQIRKLLDDGELVAADGRLYRSGSGP